MIKNLNDYQEELGLCVRCGACQAHCPVYLETRKEGAVARGKIVLVAALLDKNLELDEEGIRDAQLCLLCGSCVHSCPNKVPTDAIVAALRRDISKVKGLSKIGKGVAALTGHPRLLTSLIRSARPFSTFLFKKVPQTSGLHLRFSPENLKGRILPALPAQNLFAQLPEKLEWKKNMPALAFFAGCSITHLYPEVGLASVQLLHRLGYTVHLPREQGCCGMPAFSTGNGRLVEQLVKKNVSAFDGLPVDYIITSCASCSGTLSRLYNELQGDLAGLSSKILDIHLFLKEAGAISLLASLPKTKNRAVVTYHDPCHLRGHGITQEPRELLMALPTVDYVEMEGAAKCCGLGGTFSASQAALSRAIADNKVKGLAESGADLVASGCPGCVMQLQDIIHRAKLPMRAVHTATLAWESLTGCPHPTLSNGAL